MEANVWFATVYDIDLNDVLGDMRERGEKSCYFRTSLNVVITDKAAEFAERGGL